MKKKRIVITAVMVALTISISGCNNSGNANPAANNASPSQGNAQAVNDPSKANDDYVVRIGYGTGICQAPVHVAIEKGLFKEEGLNFEGIKVESAVAAEAVAGNQIDAGMGLVGKFAQPLENGLNLKFTTGLHTGCIKVVTQQDSGIHEIKDLRGKRVGVSGLADAPILITKRALAAAGVGITVDNLEVEFIVYSNSDLPIALKNGAIDAFAANDPVASIALAEYNLRPLLDTALSDDYKHEYCCLGFVSTSLAENHPELAAKYTRAIMKASEWIEANPLETAQLQHDKEYVNGEVEFNSSLLDSYDFKPSVEGGYDALKNTFEELYEIGILKSETDTDGLLKSSYIFLDNVK